MATIGGMVAATQHLDKLREVLSLSAPQLLAGDGVLRDVLDIVPITAKEKVALDRLLPCSEAGFAARLQQAGIRLEADQALKYRRLYTHFPVFAETVS